MNKDTEVVTMTDPAWQADLTFVEDDLNLKLQGKNQLVCQRANYISAFKTKLHLFRQQAALGNFVHFPTLQSQLQKYQNIDTNIYVGKLDALIQSFNSRFYDF